MISHNMLTVMTPGVVKCIQSPRGLALAAALLAILHLPAGAEAAYIIESAPGGMNQDEYSETGGGWVTNSSRSTADGLTPGIGSRVASTFLDGGEKHARFVPDLPVSGVYEVSVTWGNIAARKTTILHEVTHAFGITQIDIDQTATENEWVPLGQFSFMAGGSATVDISNLHVNDFGNMIADAVRWELVQEIVVPEPSGLALYALAMAGVMAARRRGRSSS